MLMPAGSGQARFWSLQRQSIYLYNGPVPQIVPESAAMLALSVVSQHRACHTPDRGVQLPGHGLPQSNTRMLPRHSQPNKLAVVALHAAQNTSVHETIVLTKTLQPFTSSLAEPECS